MDIIWKSDKLSLNPVLGLWMVHDGSFSWRFPLVGLGNLGSQNHVEMAYIYIYLCVPACVVHIYLATRCWTRPYTGHKKEQIQCYTQSRFSGVSHLRLGAMYSTDQPP